MIKQIFQNREKVHQSVSITRHSTTVPLKSMTMKDLHSHIVDEIHSHSLSTTTDSISDDECTLIITRNTMIKTVASIHRYRHRPMEIEVNVDYNEISNTKDIIRMTKPAKSRTDNISYRWLWILPIFGSLIFTLVTFFERFFAVLFGSNSLNQLQLIITVTLLSILLAVLWIYGIPAVLKKRDLRRQEFDEYILDMISKKIEALDEQLNTSQVIKCWNCFEELDVKTDVCGNCGKKQK